MKRNLCLGISILIAAFTLFGCAGMQGLPQGSALVAEYEGSFNGKFFWGSIGVTVYEAPGGLRPVVGWFQQEAEQGSNISFRGDMQGPRFQGQFTIADGNISGELSADGRLLTGVYNFKEWPFDHGTWQAQKK
jgi:hypothetical protein